MKAFRFLITSAVACMAVMVACDRSDAPKEFTAKIRGTVVDRPDSKSLRLIRGYEDPRVHGVDIPIVDGRFEYDLMTCVNEEWLLVFADEMQRGSMRPVSFFSEPGRVELTLYPFDRASEENRVSGGKLNTEYAAFRDSLKEWQTLHDEGLEKLIERGFVPVEKTMSYNSETRQYEIMEENQNRDTPEGRALYDEYLALEARTSGREPEYLRGNPSIVSYARLYTDITSGLSWGNADKYIDIYNEVGYAEKFPDSPYTRELANRLGAVGNLKVGGRYIDFTLPDLEGKEVTVSEYIAGKVALIDLWMTWCGPCRSSAIEAIPIYEEFKNKGFTVIGVNGDSDLNGIKAAVRKDGYPWPTLVDLKSEAGIWSKYGINGSGGSSYLVDRDGTILAVNPGDEELFMTLVRELLP